MKKLIALTFALFLSISAFSQEKKAVTIYNPKADAQAEINAAVAKAKAAGKHVFIQVGGNWCVWCIRFHDLVAATPELKNYMNANYETVLLNWSPENKNETILKNFKYPGRFGFPVFLIVDGDGKLIHTQNSAYLEEGDGHSVKKVMEFLKNWNAGALKPENNKY
ncbi:MAG: DUF255 domain-containing protein [Sphingobacteriales bacterium]|nr:MAG: DUF255 domain-containing protein [Sphingobacteriales bacterium]